MQGHDVERGITKVTVLSTRVLKSFVELKMINMNVIMFPLITKKNQGKAPVDLAQNGPAKNLLLQFCQTALAEAVESDPDMEDACDYHNSGSYISSRAVLRLYSFVTF